MASPDCTLMNVVMLPSPRASSCVTIPSSSGDSPAQP